MVDVAHLGKGCDHRTWQSFSASRENKLNKLPSRKLKTKKELKAKTAGQAEHKEGGGGEGQPPRPGRGKNKKN